jgi:RimJ/RimL family protein N-acetyltransferase
MNERLEFRPMTRDDLPLMLEWLRREHVRAWWGEWKALDEVVEHYLPAIEGPKPTDLFLILLDGRPAGFVQTYLVADHPDFAALVGVGPDIAGVDLFLGEADLLGRGLGTEAIGSFVRSIVFARPATVACIADPDVRNAASIRAFENAGFRRTGEFVDPEDGQRHVVMRLDRDG